MNLGWDTFDTERTSSVFAKINEIFTPNLDGSLSILRAVMRLDSDYLWLLVVIEVNGAGDILKVSI